MKKITLKAAPKGRILSNNELKEILGGVGNYSAKCTCILTLNGEAVSKNLSSNASDSESACISGCSAACDSYNKGESSPTTPVQTKQCTGFSATYTASSSGS